MVRTLEGVRFANEKKNEISFRGFEECITGHSQGVRAPGKVLGFHRHMVVETIGSKWNEEYKSIKGNSEEHRCSRHKWRNKLRKRLRRNE